jgi:hypothetical protein
VFENWAKEVVLTKSSKGGMLYALYYNLAEKSLPLSKLFYHVTGS